jgi:hypothetical protein
MDCEVFNSCHEDLQGGFCTTYHWACGAALDVAGIEAAVNGKARHIRAMLRANAKFVRLDAQQAAVHVVNCNGVVIARYPLSSRVAEGAADTSLPARLIDWATELEQALF